MSENVRLLKLIGNCSVFSVRGKIFGLSNEVIGSEWLKFHWRTNANEAIFADLVSMLLRMKMHIIEQAQSQLGYHYLWKNNNISTDDEARGKQASSRSCL